jgi:hypothetical protein
MAALLREYSLGRGIKENQRKEKNERKLKEKSINAFRHFNVCRLVIAFTSIHGTQ